MAFRCRVLELLGEADDLEDTYTAATRSKLMDAL